MDADDAGDDQMHTMVIRVWREPTHQAGFRARLTTSWKDSPDPSVDFAATPEEVVERVRQWVFEIAEGPENGASSALS